MPLEKKGVNQIRLQTLVSPELNERMQRFILREKTTVCSILREALIEFLNKERRGK